MRRLALLLGFTLVALTAMPAPPARAGGSWLAPVQDRYEPGDTATLVGYSGGGSLGELNDGPFYGYLFMLPSADEGIRPGAIPLAVGELDISRTGQAGYTAIRAAISFELPEWLPSGTYWLAYCNHGCERQLGDLIAGIFSVGIDPVYPVNRDWPITEPELATMADDAVISGPGSDRTIADLRAAGLISFDPESAAQPVTIAKRLALNNTYLQCVADRGFDLGRGADVLLRDDGLPWHVKTAIDVPGEIHGPCYELIGGAPTTASSWGPGSACAGPDPTRCGG